TIEESTPEEQDIALDPELLGTIFENLIGFYNPETKENARKQTGSFYTPKEIVDYMCRESFKETLKTRFPALSADIDNLVENNEDKLDFPNKNNLLAAITSLKILDPACGSGAFPMGMFNLMVQTVEKLQEHKTTYRNKLDIIQNCIYGIDIQNIAVEISKLRFFISLLVDYPTPNNIADFEALPNLETKFAVANTLIGIDLKKDASMLFDFNAEFRELTEIFMPFTTAKTPSEKTQIKNDFEKKKREIVNTPHSQLDTKSKQMLSAWNPFNVCYCSPFFDSEIMFGINSGFDIVIGNPPYVRKIQLNEKDKVNYDKIYFSAYKQYDIYLFFNELAMKILKNNGICSFIQPNKFLSAEYGYKLCNLLKNNAEIKIIWNVSLENVFDASVYPYVYLFKKKSFDTNFKLEKINLLEHSENLIGFDNFENNNLLIKKIQGKSIFVKDITNSIKRGLANTKINFQDSGKYCGIKSTQIENSYICPNAMIKFDYLSKADEQLKIKEFSKKIFLLPRTVLKIRAVYKNNSDQILDRIYYFENTNKNIDDRFILGILNSKLLTFYYEQIYGSTKIGGGYIDLKGNQIENFPIPSVTSAQQQPLISLVNQILSLKKENKPTTALEREIDRLVYGLYGLTEEEIKIIEGK
ncbi:MAG: Eco57I restriction-modification methylase domain-containing protein, partial [Prevotellaceae bacterium]|nr:Eco57I restriction-modification methylase domain-containing protein [Prevotellaceae bacterium]